jgi:hypothetical protein
MVGAAHAAKETGGEAIETAKDKAGGVTSQATGTLYRNIPLSVLLRVSFECVFACVSETAREMAGSAKDKLAGAVETAKEKVVGAGHAAKETAKEKLAGAAHPPKETTKEKVAGAGQAVKEKAAGAAQAVKETVGSM